MTDKLLTIDELAEALGGIGRASIYRHIQSLAGFPQPVKVGSATRFRHSEVQAFIRGDHLVGAEGDRASLKKWRAAHPSFPRKPRNKYRKDRLK